MPYRRNPIREEFVRRRGPTAGLPLFEAAKPTLAAVEQARFNAAPKAIPVATDTRNLARTIQKADAVRLGDMQQRVFDLMCGGEQSDWTNKEMARKLNIDASTVCARNYELRELILVTVSRKRICRVTGNTVTAWKAV